MIRKLTVWAALLAAVWLLPRLSHPAVDIGKLEPVELVLISVTDSGIRLETDTGRVGEGATLTDAARALRDGASAEVFLETTDKLLVQGDPSLLGDELFVFFRPSCQVCLVKQPPELREAASYLELHPAEMTLARLRGGMENWQILTMEEGRGQLAAR